MSVVLTTPLLAHRASALTVVLAAPLLADRAFAVRVMLTTPLLAYGTDAVVVVISSELVFVGHACILDPRTLGYCSWLLAMSSGSFWSLGFYGGKQKDAGNLNECNGELRQLPDVGLHFGSSIGVESAHGRQFSFGPYCDTPPRD